MISNSFISFRYAWPLLIREQEQSSNGQVMHVYLVILTVFSVAVY